MPMVIINRNVIKSNDPSKMHRVETMRRVNNSNRMAAVICKVLIIFWQEIPEIK